MLKSPIASRTVIGTLVAFYMCGAQAHIIFDRPDAEVGKSYRAALRVTHGCKGSATTRVSVTLPAGFIGAKPQPKPGWNVETTRGAYDRPYAFYHGALTEGVKTITWSGSSLPDDFTDEFIFTGLVDPSFQAGASLYFPVVQTCEAGEQRWTEIPTSAMAVPEFPAVRLKLTGPASGSSAAPAGSHPDHHSGGK